MRAAPTPELENADVAIVGLGLMGGSLALALRPHVRSLTAVELDEEARRKALNKGIVDAATADLAEGIKGAKLVILATPVRAILDILATLPAVRPDGCFVLDLGSTKENICAAMGALPEQFVTLGGHPMCGKETSGLANAERTLFEGQTFVLCKTARTNEELWQLAHSLAEAVGAVPLSLSAEEHDRLVAVVSHLPYLTASLLMRVAAGAARDEENLWSVSASGFRDTSRLAGSDPAMMLDIITTNREAILRALHDYSMQLKALLSLLESNDDTALEQWLSLVHMEHARYRREKQAGVQKGG